jgi:hypothetical protein
VFASSSLVLSDCDKVQALDLAAVASRNENALQPCAQLKHCCAHSATVVAVWVAAGEPQTLSFTKAFTPLVSNPAGSSYTVSPKQSAFVPGAGVGTGVDGAGPGGGACVVLSSKPQPGPGKLVCAIWLSSAGLDVQASFMHCAEVWSQPQLMPASTCACVAAALPAVFIIHTQLFEHWTDAQVNSACAEVDSIAMATTVLAHDITTDLMVVLLMVTG